MGFNYWIELKKENDLLKIPSSHPSFHAVFTRAPRQSVPPCVSWYKIPHCCWSPSVFLPLRLVRPKRCLMSLKWEEVGEKSRMAAGAGRTFIILNKKVLLIWG